MASRFSYGRLLRRLDQPWMWPRTRQLDGRRATAGAELETEPVLERRGPATALADHSGTAESALIQALLAGKRLRRTPLTSRTASTPVLNGPNCATQVRA